MKYEITNCGIVDKNIIRRYIMYLQMERSYSKNTLDAYMKDLQKLIYFSEEEARVLTYLIESLDETNNLKSSLYRKLCAVCDTKSIKEYSGTSKNAANVQALGNAMKDRKTVILKDYSSSSSSGSSAS